MTASSASASAPSPVPLAIARSMLSLGIEASLAFWTASASAGLPSMSPAALLGRDRDRARELGEQLPAAGIDDRLLVLDPRPFGMAGHPRHVSSYTSIRGPLLIACPRRRPSPTSSRPTTSAGCTATRSTATSPSRSAAPLRRSWPTSRASRPPELRVGLGRDMRLGAPELAERYRDRARRRGRPRDRRRDGGHGDALLPRRLARARRRADVHRLAQPQGLHGRQARPAGRLAAVAATRASARSAPLVAAACARRSGRRLGRAGRRLRRPSRRRSAVRRPERAAPAQDRARRRQRDGRADGRAAAGGLPGLELVPALLGAGRRVPRP